MRRARVTGLIVGVVLVVGVGAAILIAAGDDGSLAGGSASISPTTSASASARPTPAQTEDEPAAVTPSAAPAESPAAGAYLDYSEAAFASADGAKVLFFHAPWCPQCRALEADILANGVPAGITVLKVDFDSSQSLRQRHGVTLQTTMVVVDGNGDAVGSFVAYDEPTIAAVTSALAIP